jgi:hypothetical protein
LRLLFLEEINKYAGVGFSGVGIESFGVEDVELSTPYERISFSTLPVMP